jgi:hypothetical protein
VTTREKRLLLLVGLAAALWFGNRGLNAYREAVLLSSNEQLAAMSELADAQTALHRGQKARKDLNRWRRQSLPTDADIAESLYQEWLKGELQEAGLKIDQIRDRSQNNRSRGSVDQQAIETLVEGQGTMEQLANFLARFYAAEHLHRISVASIVPTEDRATLKFTLQVDGLILADCQRTDQLADADRPTPTPASEQAVQRVSQRNLFAVYQPGQATGPGVQRGPKTVMGKPDGEAAKQEVLSAITYGGNGWRADVRNTKSGRVRHFHNGDAIEIGDWRGEVVRLNERGMIVETPEGRFEIRGASSFADAEPVDLPSS